MVFLSTIAASSSTGSTVTPGANHSMITSISITNTDTNAYTLTLNQIRSSTTDPLVTVTLPASSGNVAGTVPFNLLTPALIPALPSTSQGQPFLIFEGSNDLADTFNITTSSNVASGKQVIARFQGCNF